MKQILGNEERQQLDQRIAAAEKRTGAQIVLAIVERSDVYAEIPWKAFAMGSSITGLLALIFNLYKPLLTANTAALSAIVMILATGAGLSLLSVFLPPLARFFLDNHRAEVETRQYAESLFLAREIFATHERRGVLVLVSLFERQVIILPDSGLAGQLNQDNMQKIIACMQPLLASGHMARALENGLDKLQEIISTAVLRESRENELPNSIIEETGA